MAEKKKIIPKIKKDLKAFLADESGKITKEDVLKLSLGAMMVGGIVPNADAGWHCNNTPASSHANWGSTAGQSTYVNTAVAVDKGCGVVYDRMIGNVYTNQGIAPYSVMVNGHANSSATIQGSVLNGMNANIATYTAHSNHSNHSSGGWC